MAGPALTSSPGDLRMASLRAAILSVASATLVVASLGYAVVELRDDEHVITALRAELAVAAGANARIESIDDKTRKALDTRLITTQGKLTSAQKRAAELSDWNAKAQNQINKLQQDLGDSGTQNSELLGNLNDAKVQIEKLNGQINVLQTTVNSQKGISGQFHDLQNDYNGLQDRLNSAQAQNSELLKQVEVWKARANSQNATTPETQDILRSLRLCKFQLTKACGSAPAHPPG